MNSITYHVKQLTTGVYCVNQRTAVSFPPFFGLAQGISALTNSILGLK
jgi:hypothetical protein